MWLKRTFDPVILGCEHITHVLGGKYPPSGADNDFSRLTCASFSEPLNDSDQLKQPERTEHADNSPGKQREFMWSEQQ